MGIVKRVFFYVHWALGLLLGFWAVVIGFSGAFVVFEQDLVYWANGSPFQIVSRSQPVPPKQLSPNQLFANARAFNPTDFVNRMVFSGDPREGVGIDLSATNYGQSVEIENQYTGQIKNIDYTQSNWLSRLSTTMEGVHRSLGFTLFGLRAPAPPAWVKFWVAFSILFISLTGIYLRWPKSKLSDWRSWFKINFKLTGYNFQYALHAVIGTVVLLAYISMAHSGILNEIGINWYMKLVGRVTNSRPARYVNYDPVKSKATANRTDYNMDLLWPAFQRKVPKYAMAEVDFKESTPDSLKIEYYFTKIRNYKGGHSPTLNSQVNVMVLDAHTGEVILNNLFSDRPLIDQIITRNFDFHNGNILGLPGRIFFCFACLMMPVMFITGWIMYLQRKLREHRAKLTNVEFDTEVLTPAIAGAPSWLIAYASQTGTAEQLARKTARALAAAGVPSRVSALAQLKPADLQGCERALFFASTHGEGDPPDSARPFVRNVMAGAIPLKQLQCGVVALGDQAYTHFCGFGRKLDGWLREQGAQPLFDRIDVNNMDPEALGIWKSQLSRIARIEDLADWKSEVIYESWQLAERRHLNAGSQGGEAYHLELEPAPGRPLPLWEAGDLVEILAPADRKRAREYSIASIHADGRVHLLVRQERRTDGTMGICSGWLTAEASVGGPIELRLKENHNFRMNGNSGRPMILIGNGTGLAGLRAHLKARVAQGASHNWLVFGERNAAYDSFYADELKRWRAQGLLMRLDLVYSRDQPERRYVQDQLRGSKDEVRSWLKDGAAIYVCGSLKGMAGGVEEALIEIVGVDGLDALTLEGRYCRDVY